MRLCEPLDSRVGARRGEADGDAIAPIRVPGAVCGRVPPAYTPPFPDGVSAQRWNYLLLGLIQWRLSKRAELLSMRS